MRENRKNIKIILAVFVILYLLLLAFRPLITPDETRYAEISREMISSSDWVVPHLNGLRYFEKPVGGYWMNSLAMLIFGYNNFGIRLVSALSAGGVALLLYFFIKREFDAVTGRFAAISYLLTGGVFAIGTTAVLDSMLTMALTAAMMLFYLAFQATNQLRRGLLLAAFGAVAGWGFLVKGFLVFAVIGLATGSYIALEFHRNHWAVWKRHSVKTHLKSVLLMLCCIIVPLLLVVLPWSIMIYQREPDFWRFFFIEEHLQRFLAKNAQHAEPFWFFLPVILVAMLPWSLLFPPLFRRWREFDWHIPLLRYAMLWFGLPLLFFSASRGKLPTYILPCFPPLIIIFSFMMRRLFDAPEAKDIRWLHGLARVFLALCLLLIVVLIGLNFIPLSGLPGGDGKAVTLFSPAEWWKQGLIITVAVVWFIAARQLLRVKNCRKKIYCFMVGPALLYLLSFIIIPDRALSYKMPGDFLRRQCQLITPKTVIVAEYRLAHAVCWFYQRDNLYLLFYPNEFEYGINYSPVTKRRLLDGGQFRELARNRRGHLVLFITPRRYEKYLIKGKLLPPPARVSRGNGCVMLQY